MATVVPLNGQVRDERVDRIVRSIQSSRIPPRPWVEAHDLADEPEPEHEWIIEGLVERQGRIILAGAEGAGKSLVALTLAVQAAAGLPVLGYFRARAPMRVVYIDLEMGRSSTRRRLRQLRISAGSHLARGALQLHLRPDGLDLASAAERSEIHAHLAHYEPELVIIDPLYKLALTDLTYEKETRPVLKFLDELRLAYQCGIILVHHLRKRPQGEQSRGKDSSDVFGSSVFLRWPEVILLLHQDSVRATKDRDGHFEGKALFPVERGGIWPVGLKPPVAGTRAEVLQVLATGEMTANEVCQTVTARRSDVLFTIKTLKTEGLITERARKLVLQ